LAKAAASPAQAQQALQLQERQQQQGLASVLAGSSTAGVAAAFIACVTDGGN
jgi:hypothetical protein